MTRGVLSRMRRSVATTRRAVAGALAVGALTAAGSASALPAFPGAEGFGSETPGGRGGRVIAVTSLEDSGPGTLREAIEAEGPRNVVFRTGGTIVLASPLRISTPYLTIAGQTAPGAGIQIRNDSEGSAPWDSFPSLVITTHDVVIRYLRIRPGSPDPDPTCETDPPAPEERRCVPPSDIDAIQMDGAHDVVIDHVSASWATDELIGVASARDISIQWSFLSEGLNYLLYDTGGGMHGKGMLFGNAARASQGKYSGRASIHHNLWAHFLIRTPQLNNACADATNPSDCVVDVTNNVVYNWGRFGTLLNNGYGNQFVNLVGNYYRPGPSTRKSATAISMRDWTETTTALGAGSSLSVFLDGNLAYPGNALSSADCYRVSRREEGSQRLDACSIEDYRADRPHAVPRVTRLPGAELFDRVLQEAGASRRLDDAGNWVPARDATDARIVANVRTGGGRIPAAPTHFPGWPELHPGTRPIDSDGDGMPDAWERLHGFDSQTPADPGVDTDGDGYTDVEEYLNGADPRQG